MKKIIISEEEKKSILGLHQTQKDTKNYFGKLSEQMDQQLNGESEMAEEEEMEEQEEVATEDPIYEIEFGTGFEDEEMHSDDTEDYGGGEEMGPDLEVLEQDDDMDMDAPTC